VTNLEYIFHPSSIAVVGASPDPSSFATMVFLNPLIQFGYKGRIYPIHPKASEVSGLKAYPSILDIPGTVDHVICAIRAALTPQLMKECVSKKVKTIHLFTSGFSETGEEEKIRLEKEITEIAHQGGVRVIGPNGMGIYCPSSGISYDATFPEESGGVGFLSQSGGNSIEGVQLGAARGIHFSKVVSFGNASDLNEADFMEYFTHDPETKIIIGYIEGTKDGRRFVNALQEAARAKPIIIIKGGVTEAGTKAVASHTGALAGSTIVWSSLFKQLGIIQLYELEELIDMALLFQHLKPIQGRKVGLIGIGGGSSVLVTDSCEKEGIVIPPLPSEVRGKLREIIPEEVDPGTSVRNPVDLSASGWNSDIFLPSLETIADYDGIDFILTYINVAFGLYRGTSAQLNMCVNAIIQAKKNFDKPMSMIIRHSGTPEAVNLAASIQKRCLREGIPVFPSFDRAARAMNRFIRYYETIMR
jgi:Acyl-CoA synthetase (NDP forming)